MRPLRPRNRGGKLLPGACRGTGKRRLHGLYHRPHLAGVGGGLEMPRPEGSPIGALKGERELHGARLLALRVDLRKRQEVSCEVCRVVKLGFRGTVR